ncbi:MAG: alanine racemase [Proteobacteria bacterium]|nr:alanine racemase [Pseudomonadota bacterium]
MPAIDAAPATDAAFLTIDLDAVVENWRRLGAAAGGTAIAAVVKADGYGLGAIPVARALAAAGCRCFFVAHVEEALALRAALAAPEIAVLNGCPDGAAALFAEERLSPVLNDLGRLAAWLGFAAGRADAPPAILHVDTGMNRLGLPPEEVGAARALAGFAACRWRNLMSHLACADEPDHPLNETQRRRFERVRGQLPPLPASLAASSGIFLGRPYWFDEVRPGAALYGIAPQPGQPNPLAQPLRLQAKILQVRRVDRGGSVGYGAAHKLAGSTKIATIAIGYADGYLRAASARGALRVAGVAVPVVGRVSMDLITLDVGALPDAAVAPGALVDVLGPQRTPDDLAHDAGTIGYEILTSLGARYHRRYIGGTA